MRSVAHVVLLCLVLALLLLASGLAGLAVETTAPDQGLITAHPSFIATTRLTPAGVGLLAFVRHSVLTTSLLVSHP